MAYGAGLTPIPLSITGTANSVAVVTPPTNGRAIVDRMTISYIPDTGFAETDNFTYLASNNGANSAPATVTISVANPAITITAGGALTATVGAPYGETFTFNGGTAFTNYQVTGLPAEGAGREQRGEQHRNHRHPDQRGQLPEYRIGDRCLDRDGAVQHEPGLHACRRSTDAEHDPRGRDANRRL